MYPEFAYTGEMQLILAGVSTVSALIFIYLIANLLLQLYGEKASFKRKAVFAFLIGGILNQAWVYAIYFIGGRQSFSPLVYAIVVNPNPIFALLYFLIGVKVLRLSPIRSVKLMRSVYLYYVLIKSFNRLLTSIFFEQPPGRYNYMLSTINQLVLLVIILVVYFITKKLLERYKYVINLNLFVSFRRELFVYFLHATGVYLVMLGLPIFISETIAVDFVIFLLFLLSFTLTVLYDMYVTVKNEAQNRSKHISLLSKGVLADDSGDVLELRGRINENPSLVSLLINKYDYAESQGVEMSIVLLSRLDNLIMDNVDACVVTSCLLDNAIESAAGSKQKRMTYSVEDKDNGGKMMIISCSADAPPDMDAARFLDVVTEKGNQGRGGAAIRRILSKYENCSIQFAGSNDEVSVYLEIK